MSVFIVTDECRGIAAFFSRDLAEEYAARTYIQSNWACAVPSYEINELMVDSE